MPGLNDLFSVDLLGDDVLAGDPHPKLDLRLVVAGIAHNPAGSEPPPRIEVRLSEKSLDDLIAKALAVKEQIRARDHQRQVAARFAPISLDERRDAKAAGNFLGSWQAGTRRARAEAPPESPVERTMMLRKIDLTTRGVRFQNDTDLLQRLVHSLRAM